MRTQGSGARFNLVLLRRGGASARVALTSSLDLSERRLVLRLEAEEDGGLLGRLLDLPDAGSWQMSLSGNAPLDDWSGETRLTEGGFSRSRPRFSCGPGAPLAWNWTVRCSPIQPCCPPS